MRACVRCAGAYAYAITNATGPTAFALSRQGLPNLAGSDAAKVANGAYTVFEEGEATNEAAGVDLVIAATGSEVALAISAAASIAGRVRVVSMPSLELYEKQSAEYKRSLFPAGVPVMSVEAAATTGWAKIAHACVGIDTFGLSAPASDAFKHFGFTTEAVAAKGNAVSRPSRVRAAASCAACACVVVGARAFSAVLMHALPVGPAPDGRVLHHPCRTRAVGTRVLDALCHTHGAFVHGRVRPWSR